MKNKGIKRKGNVRRGNTYPFMGARLACIRPSLTNPMHACVVFETSSVFSLCPPLPPLSVSFHLSGDVVRCHVLEAGIFDRRIL